MADGTEQSGTRMFCHPTMLELAKRITATLATRTNELCVDFREDILWNTFEDGYPNIFIENIEECAGKNIIFLGSFHSPGLIFEQLSVLCALPRSSIRSLLFILPYFPTGTMERVDTEGQIATAATMARLLSALPLTAMGPAKLLVYDIHALQERFYFTDHLIPRLVSAIPRFLKELETMSRGEKIAIAFPDEGAHKRFSAYFKNFPIVRCIKRRNGQEREVTIVDGSAENKHVIIVDDLIMTGGTVLKCVDCLKKANAARVSVYVTHAVFPQYSWKKFVQNEGGSEGNLRTFWITDSIPHATEITKHSPFKLLSLANSICDALRMSS